MNHCFQVFRARKTLREMFYDRGYPISTPAFETQMEHFSFWFQRQKEWTMVFEKPHKKAMVFFVMEPKVGVACIRETFETLKEQHAQLGIVVFIDLITPFAKQEIIKLIRETKIEFQSFKRLHLQYNLTRHLKVPKHTILTKDEKDALLLKYNCPLEKLPHLPSNDKMAAYLGMKKGQVVKVTRMSPEGHTYFNYRVVTKPLDKKH